MKITKAGAVAVAAFAALSLAACGSGFSNTGPSASGVPQDPKAPLNILIGSSGDAETNAVKSAVADWSSQSGIQATVTVASDLNQELAQGFSSGKPADLFYLSTDQLANYASNGSLLVYGDQLPNKSDFYPSLVKSFTYNGQLVCAPKDFSTLQLIINEGLWQKAGLTDADVPTTWDQLSAVAKKLTSGKVTGLVIGGEYARIGAFMTQAGGNLMNDDSSQATADTPANLSALQYVQDNLKAGDFKFAADVGAGWGGEAFGKQLGAMTIEGNWITGAMSSDYKNVQYKVVPLPAGPAGQGTLQFTNCWGVAADSPNQAGALSLVQALTSTQDQLGFSKAFGVMPSIQSAADQWKTDNPALVPFLDAAQYAHGVPTAKGAADVVSDFNSQVSQLKTADPQAILTQTQSELAALVQ